MRDRLTALVTGATGGVGASLVEAFCDRGMTVHAMGRNNDRLDKLAAKTGCKPHCIDLAEIAKARDVCSGLEIDILVNAAGLGATPGGLQQAEYDSIDAVIDINLRAPIHLMRQIIPGMIERGFGHIINIGSVAALYPIPGISIYGASKAAIHGLSALLRLDLSGTALRVTEICPGRIETGFFAAQMGDEEKARKAYIDGFESLQPDDITASVLFAMDAPSHVNISTIELSPQAQVFGGIEFVKSDE